MITLPKKVLQVINSLCARFLWRGTVAGGKGSFLVSWKEVCKDKKEGGLGLSDLSTLNNAMRLNQLWKFSTDSDNVWHSWIRAYWTKGRHWWEVDSSNNSSWVIKELEASKRLSSICVSNHHGILRWEGNGSGFSVKDTYDTIREHSDKVEWYKMVWNRFNSPRSSFHLWLLAKNRLLTKERMLNMGMLVDTNCVLCRGVAETTSHLFFECLFAVRILKAVFLFLQVRRAPNSWHLLIPWFNSMKQQALRTRMLAAAISMAAYEVWRARNAKIFNSEAPSIERAVRRVVWFLKMKIAAIDCTKVNLEDRAWCQTLGYT